MSKQQPKKQRKARKSTDAAAVVALAKQLHKKGMTQTDAYKQLRKRFGISQVFPHFRRAGYEWGAKK